MESIKANPRILPPKWSSDPFFAEQVYAKIDRGLKEGDSYANIARQVGVSDRTVARRAAAHRMGPRVKPYLSHEQVVEIRRLCTELPYSVVAKKFNISPEHASRIANYKRRLND